jgi:hypothetical protein
MKGVQRVEDTGTNFAEARNVGANALQAFIE